MKNVTRKDTIFKLLDQDGPFATKEIVPDKRIFSSLSRDQAVSLQKTNLFNRYRITRNQIFEFLDKATIFL